MKFFKLFTVFRKVILLFNVNLTYLFLAEHYKSDFSNYADDTTPYNCGSTFLETISDLEITLDNLFNWFCYNNFKANALKCHLSLLPFNAKSISIKSSVIEDSSNEKFLGITIDSNLTFEKHIKKKKGSLKFKKV